VTGDPYLQLLAAFIFQSFLCNVKKKEEKRTVQEIDTSTHCYYWLS